MPIVLFSSRGHEESLGGTQRQLSLQTVRFIYYRTNPLSVSQSLLCED